jgi:hypothetical protein
MQEISQARVGKYWAAIKFFSHMLIDIELCNEKKIKFFLEVIIM